ncbi:DNA gyrase subunit A [Candidatus Magnetobacterium bavaricum]|uniref:DNA gyrase subunit A n=1 Tax=Candidatus Magnetobacterium bavaricum TaxID=29290 RepID=A0A0F3GNT3_9BACT|nr:DNA gyrase subunit A [Candidatus Magnetobacterium bavaricum]
MTSMETREEDYVQQLFIGSTHNHILFFSNFGRLYLLKIYQIPEAGRAAKGKAIVNLLQLQPGETIATALPIKGFDKGYLIMFTKKGIVKKTLLREFSNPRGKGVIAINIDEDDELMAVRYADGQSDVLIGTCLGHAIRFNEEDVRSTGRSSRGVKGIRLKKDDEVVSAEVVEDKTTLLNVTEFGFGKRSNLQDYPLQARGGQGVKSIKVTEKGGKVVGLIQVRDEDEIMVVTKSGKSIRTIAGAISVTGRNTQGVKLMDVGKDNMIMSIGKAAEKDRVEVGTPPFYSLPQGEGD